MASNCRIALSRMSRGVLSQVLRINRSPSAQFGPADSPSCLNIRGPVLPAAILPAHQLFSPAYRKNERNALALLAIEARHQFCLPSDSRKLSTSAIRTSENGRV